MGFEVFFCRIWYCFVPWQRSAWPGVVAVEGEDVMVSLEGLVVDVGGGWTEVVRGRIF